MAVAMEERWGFLAPWCRLLKGRIYCIESFRSVGVWSTESTVSVKMPRRSEPPPGSRQGREREETEEQFRANFHKTREALALLAAVEFVSYDAWRYLLKKHCGVKVGKEGEEKFETIRAKFTVDMDLGVRIDTEAPDRVDFDLVRLCGTHQRDHASSEYLETLRKIAGMDKRLQHTQPIMDIKIPVQVSLAEDLEALADMQDVVRAEHLIKRQWEDHNELQVASPGSLRCTFVLTPTHVSFNDMDTGLVVTPEFAEAVKRLVRDNVWLSGLQHVSEAGLTDVDLNNDRAVKKAVGQLMRSSFDSTRRLCDQANGEYHFDSENGSNPLQLGLVDMGADHSTPNCYLEGLCSAMVTNQTAKGITLQLAGSPSEPLRSQFWFKWLAYGLFSRRAVANSAWERLSLQIGGITIEDAEAFASIVNAEHPEETLCGRPRGKIAERDATLRDGAQIRWHFDETGEPVSTSAVLTAPSPIHFVRTFSDDGSSQWVDAIVPGFGRCQVRRGDLSFDQSSGANIQGATGLKTLEVEFSGWDGANWTGLPNFLKTVGSSLKSLALSGPRDELDDTVIFQQCPHLEELWLCGGWIDVVLDFSDYRASGGSLSNLSSTNWHSITALSEALCDGENPVSKCIRKLRVRLMRQWDGWHEVPADYEPQGFDADLKPLLQILETNQSLEHFEIIVPRQYQDYIGQFRQYHLEALPRASEPLPTASKVAFLSVFSDHKGSAEPDTKRSRRNATPHQSHRKELPQDALSSIFAFAAPPVLRRVYFRSRMHMTEHQILVFPD